MKVIVGGGEMTNKSMRDSFWDEFYYAAKNNKDIMLVCADMGAPSLDKFREDLPEQYFNVGIAEHSMMSFAGGLAKEGKIVYTYAIAPFATSRCYEFSKLNMGLMKLPIKIVGVGAGFGYDDSGPTHHTTEDISIMRAIPNIEVWSPSDNISTRAIGNLGFKSRTPAYMRLDRHTMPDIHNTADDFSIGFKELKEGDKKVIISTGNMVHKALEASGRITGERVGVIDLYKLKPVNAVALAETLKKYQQAISVEEHLLDGGLGSIVAETIMDAGINTKLRRIGLTDYVYIYGGRENIQEKCGIGLDRIVEVVRGL
jgi:transketolase